jgi:hypothetical protein
VRRCERGRHLARDRQRLVQRHGALSDPFRERLALDEFEHERRDGGLPDGMKSSNP